MSAVPPFPYNNAKGLAAANAGKPLAALNGDVEPILARLRTGEAVSSIAKSLGISTQVIYEWLLRHCPEEWQSIMASKALVRIEDAEERIDAAADNVEVSKARESHRMASWMLERSCRKLFGDAKNEGSGMILNVFVDRACGEVVIDNP